VKDEGEGWFKNLRIKMNKLGIVNWLLISSVMKKFDYVKRIINLTKNYNKVLRYDYI